MGEDTLSEGFKACKDYQFKLASVAADGLPSFDKLFVKQEGSDELLWLRAERFQFPDFTAALSLRDSLSKKSSLHNTSRQDQSEFFRKAHLLDAHKFYPVQYKNRANLKCYNSHCAERYKDSIAAHLWDLRLHELEYAHVDVLSNKVKQHNSFASRFFKTRF